LGRRTRERAPAGEAPVAEGVPVADGVPAAGLALASVLGVDMFCCVCDGPSTLLPAETERVGVTGTPPVPASPPN
jgi:hypothetical protein